MMLLNWLEGKIRDYDEADADLNQFRDWQRGVPKRHSDARIALQTSSQYFGFAPLHYFLPVPPYSSCSTGRS